MRADNKYLDVLFLLLLAVVIIGLPYGIRTYDRQVWQKKMEPGAKEFTLTGDTKRGWVLGDVHALDVLSLGQFHDHIEKPVIQVHKGDRVVFKLKSSDVIHGFSLKDAGIIITDGIHPGKVVLVSFIADKVGTFTFSCNAICGKNHEKMQGTLIVRA
jgi:heme/copper-type cytochrome/quinol oxidase subunit 2